MEQIRDHIFSNPLKSVFQKFCDAEEGEGQRVQAATDCYNQPSKDQLARGRHRTGFSSGIGIG